MFVEFVAMPMLAVSFAILIAAVATYESSPSKNELYAIAASAVAIPFLAMSVFFRKSIVVINPKLISKKEPEKVQWAEAIGIAAGFLAIISYIASVKVCLASLFVISLVVAFAMHVNYLLKARSGKQRG
ncbi:MAG: hypothetical protein ACRBEE_16185 [Arenicella sp.]